MGDVYCNNCGHKNPIGSNFCSSCGAILETDSPENTTITFHPTSPVDPLGQLRIAVAEIDRAEGHVVAHGGHEQLIVGILEDNADPATDLPQRRFADRQPVDGHRAGPRGQGPVQVQDQRRLASAMDGPSVTPVGT